MPRVIRSLLIHIYGRYLKGKMPTIFSRFPVCGGTMRAGSLEIMGEHSGSPQLGDALRCAATAAAVHIPFVAS